MFRCLPLDPLSESSASAQRHGPSSTTSKFFNKFSRSVAPDWHASIPIARLRLKSRSGWHIGKPNAQRFPHLETASEATRSHTLRMHLRPLQLIFPSLSSDDDSARESDHEEPSSLKADPPPIKKSSAVSADPVDPPFMKALTSLKVCTLCDGVFKVVTLARTLPLHITLQRSPLRWQP